MRPVESMLTRSMLLLILCGFDFCFLLTSYGVLRVLRISVNWMTWIAGSLIITVSAAVCLTIALPNLFPEQFKAGGNLVGAIAFFVAVYAASQWATRQWYRRVKKDASQWLRQSSKNVLMFLRKHHQFFGWVVGAGSLAHMIFFFPIMAHISLYEEITGFIAIGILVLIALLGVWLWIESSLRKKRMPKTVHTIHSALTIAFFIMLFLHI
jgi:hypothetical protein